ncbi:MAG: DUF5693 family protein [Armatimonadota bacterium]|nr:DUF5693 family protein [Armatimonadota bacterium]MDR7533300.1 DUF5693 family protein [Armatimonadota bacterium]MDR7536581.1 DUF5693 family protein [Armatimonadota bacterium]
MSRRLLVGCLLVGLVAAGVIAGFRHRVEGGYRTVELVLDGPDWTMLARREGRPVQAVLREARRRGATSVAVPDATLRQLAEDGVVAYAAGGALLAQARGAALAGGFARLHARGAIRTDAVYITASPDVLSWVEAMLRVLLGAGRVAVRDGVVEARGAVADLEELGLGVDRRLVARAREAGLRTVLRPRNYRGLTAESLRVLVDGYAAAAPAPTLVFALTEVQGYEGLVDAAAEQYRRVGARFGRIEVFTARRKQKGEDRLTALLRPDVIRVFSVTPEELQQLRPDEVADRFVRAAQERNLRLLYLRPLLNTPAGISALETNFQLVEAIVTDLRGLGFTPGRARSLPPDVVPGPPAAAAVLAALAALGGAALGLLVLDDLARTLGVRLPRAVGAAVLIGAAGGTLVATGRSWEELWRQVLALGIAVAGAAGATVWAMPRPVPGAGRRILAGYLTLARAVGLAAAAGLLVAALLSRWAFMLAFRTFLGVKAAHVVPVVVVGVWLVFAHRPSGGWRAAAAEIAAWLARPLRVGTALALLAIGVAAVMLLARTGNISVPLSSAEQQLRQALEARLVARPRTKEFLLGYPALVLAGAAAASGRQETALAFALLGTVGTAGAINSFSHLHTPLLHTVWRTVHALWLGAVLVLPAAVVVLWIPRRTPPS